MHLTDKYHRLFAHFLDFLHEGIDLDEVVFNLLDAFRLLKRVLVIVSVAPQIDLVLELQDIVQDERQTRVVSVLNLCHHIHFILRLSYARMEKLRLRRSP